MSASRGAASCRSATLARISSTAVAAASSAAVAAATARSAVVAASSRCVTRSCAGGTCRSTDSTSSSTCRSRPALSVAATVVACDRRCLECGRSRAGGPTAPVLTAPRPPPAPPAVAAAGHLSTASRRDPAPVRHAPAPPPCAPGGHGDDVRVACTRSTSPSPPRGPRRPPVALGRQRADARPDITMWKSSIESTRPAPRASCSPRIASSLCGVHLVAPRLQLDPVVVGRLDRDPGVVARSARPACSRTSSMRRGSGPRGPGGNDQWILADVPRGALGPRCFDLLSSASIVSAAASFVRGAAGERRTPAAERTGIEWAGGGQTGLHDAQIARHGLDSLQRAHQFRGGVVGEWDHPARPLQCPIESVGCRGDTCRGVGCGTCQPCGLLLRRELLGQFVASRRPLFHFPEQLAERFGGCGSRLAGAVAVSERLLQLLPGRPGDLLASVELVLCCSARPIECCSRYRGEIGGPHRIRASEPGLLLDVLCVALCGSQGCSDSIPLPSSLSSAAPVVNSRRCRRVG